ncbi:MAG: hypothetical protein ACXV8Q_16040 [Methylobacter sp.]
MKAVIFLKTLLRVTGFVLCCLMPAHAGSQKAFDQSDPPSDLILTLPDKWLADEKMNTLSSSDMSAHNNNEAQAFALKKTPVNVDCDVDVIQNAAGDIPLSNRLFGECDLHYHY